MRRVVQLLKNNRGQALVEFALMLPIFIILLMAIIDFGRVIHEYLVVSTAAHEGARSMAIWDSEATARTSVMRVASSLPTSGGTVNIVINTAEPRTTGAPVEVRVSHNVRIFTPLIQKFLPDPFTVTGVAVNRIQ